MWRKIIQNFWFKLVAVVMALLLWFHVATDNTYEYSDKFPLEIVGIPEPLLLAEKLPDYVNVTIQGKGKDLLKLMVAEKDSLKIDTREFKRGETDYLIEPENVPLPEGLELRVTVILPPKKLKIKLDYSMEKKLQVQLKVSVLPAEGFVQVGEVHFDPKEIEISGPRMWVRNLTDIYTQGQIVENAKEPVSEQIDLMLPEGYNLTLSQPKIRYSVNIEKIEEKQLSKLPLSPVNVPRRTEVTLQPDSINLTVAGAQSLITRVSVDSIRATVDCSKISKGQNLTLPIWVDLPKGIRLIRVDPDSAKAFTE
jgi:YbbR domain-containing protein